MATAVATPALAATTRAFARDPGACKTLIAAEFGSRTRGSARAPETRAALGARASARAATRVLRARVAGGTEWNDEANGETNDDELDSDPDDVDDDETERRDDPSDDPSVRAGDVFLGRRAEDVRASSGASRDGRTDDTDDTDDTDERKASSTRSRARSGSVDENWADDPRFGCSPGQLWVNAVACVGATQNPKHALDAAEFLARLGAARAGDGDVFGIEPGIAGSSDGGFARLTLSLAARHDVHGARAAELRFVLEHPLAFGAASAAFGWFCLSVASRRRRAEALRASLLNDGVDLTNVFDDHLETLEYLREMRDRGALALGIETCAARRVETETRYLGVAALRDWREFYGARGIDLATKDDVKKVKTYVEHLHHLEGCLLGEGRGEKSEPSEEER